MPSARSTPDYGFICLRGLHSAPPALRCRDDVSLGQPESPLLGNTSERTRQQTDDTLQDPSRRVPTFPGASSEISGVSLERPKFVRLRSMASPVKAARGLRPPASGAPPITSRDNRWLK